MTTEYIEREKLPQKKERGFFLDDDFNAGWNACLNNIKSIPAADVRPVVQGHWIDGACSNCGFFTDVVMSRFFSYCPNCGADMREQTKEEI
jgi:hypothetical protein